MNVFRTIALLAIPHTTSSATDEAGKTFLATNGKRPEVTKLPSGLQYEVLTSGASNGSFPNRSSKCVCHYIGNLVNGVEFSNSYKQGSPLVIKPSHVIAGWTEALLMMRAGDKWRLFLPSELGYGDSGTGWGLFGTAVPGNAATIFELELVEIREPTLMDAIGIDLDFPGVKVLTCFAVTIILLRFAGVPIFGKYIRRIPLKQVVGLPENPRVFIEVKVGNSDPRCIEIELFAKHFPKTAENFRALCTGENGTGKKGKPLHFKDCKFHRIVPGFMAQGGDITKGNGKGGDSIYDGPFDDEWDSGFVRHSKRGLLSMANKGRNTNTSQFFITFSDAFHLDKKSVVFGHVVDGIEVLKDIEKAGRRSGEPKEDVLIVSCGEVKTKAT